jgi:hypothetical protein
MEVRDVMADRYTKVILTMIAVMLAAVLVRVYSEPLPQAEARAHTFRDLVLGYQGKAIDRGSGWKLVAVKGDYVVFESPDRRHRLFMPLSGIASIEVRPERVIVHTRPE